MQVFGFTLNLLTLLAIVLAVGLVVDDAIVVVENVERHIREGKTPMRAALVGARELVGPIIAMTITLAAVYAPIGFQGGLTGALFREFAFTLAGAVFISGIVALTLSPMMSSRLLAGPRAHAARRRASIARSTGCKRATAARSARRFARGPWSTSCGSCLTLAGGADVHVLADGAGAGRRSGRRLRRRRRRRPTRRIEQTDALRRRDPDDLFQSMPEFDHSFQLTFPTGGFGGMLCRSRGTSASGAIFPDPAEVRPRSRTSRASARRHSCRRRCRARGPFPSSS